MECLRTQAALLAAPRGLALQPRRAPAGAGAGGRVMARRAMVVPRAISYQDEQVFGGHRHAPQGPPARELSEEEKQRAVERETQRIRTQTEQRSRKLQDEAHLHHLDHELKFGKLMFGQENYESALAHFTKVVQGSAPETYHRCEGTLQKAKCLEKLGRQAEAHALYESLIQFRAPYPNIKRQAAQALFGTEGDGKEAPRYDDYMYRMFMTGFGTYMPKEKHIETEEEKVLLRVVPWAILLMAPLLLAYLMLFPK